jgi:hypothetical protein
MLLQLQKYILKVNYIKCKHQYIADYLSRNNKGTDENEEKQCDGEIYELKNVSKDEKIDEIRQHTHMATDPKLQKMQYTMSGWPTKMKLWRFAD